MKSNVEIIQETIEQIVNQKKIDMWDKFFSPDYVERGAPFIGMGFSRDTSGEKFIVNMVIPGSPVDGKLQVGDELVWVDDDDRRWETNEEIEQALSGKTYTVGVRRGDQTLAYDLERKLIRGFDTNTEKAKVEMQAFMTEEFPDLHVDITLMVADGDMVVSLLEYRGTYTEYQREAIW